MIIKNKIILIIITMLLIIGCSKKDNKVEEYEGIDKLITYQIPENYIHEKNDVYNDSNELISIHYGDNKASIYFMILSYKGKAVMGSDETFAEWLKSTENIAETFELKNLKTKAYLLPIGIKTNDENAREKSIIEAIFSYKDYLIMAGMFNHEGENITESQKIIFKGLLTSIDINNHITPKSIDELIQYDIPENASFEYYAVASGEFYDSTIESKENIISKQYSFLNGGNFSISIFSYQGYAQNELDIGGKKIDYKKYYKINNKTKKLETNFGIFYIQSLTSDDTPNMVLRSLVEKDDYVYEIVLSNGDEKYTKEQKEWFYNFLKGLKEKSMIIK